MQLNNIHKLVDCKHEVRFKATYVYVISDTGIVFSGFINGNFYVLSAFVVANVLLSNVIETESIKWHNILSHIGQDRLSRLVKNELISSMNKVILPIFEPCLAGIVTKKSFYMAKRASAPHDLIHLD